MKIFPKQKVVAYIDGANLHKGIASLGWKLDYNIFRRWLGQKFDVYTAYLFIGMIAGNTEMYTALSEAGFTLVFKQVVFDKDGKAKGNCDADLIVRAARDVYEEDVQSVILVSSDGDYTPLVRLWVEKGRSCTIVSPSEMRRCSILLKRTGVPIVSLADMEGKLAYQRKIKRPPAGTNPRKGPFRGE